MPLPLRSSHHHQEQPTPSAAAAAAKAGPPEDDSLRFYPRLRKAFNSCLRGSLRDYENVVLCSHENLDGGGGEAGETASNKFYAESGGEGLQLTSAGMRRMCRNWDTVMKRMVRTSEGQLYCRYGIHQNYFEEFYRHFFWNLRHKNRTFGPT